MEIPDFGSRLLSGRSCSITLCVCGDGTDTVLFETVERSWNGSLTHPTDKGNAAKQVWLTLIKVIIFLCPQWKT